MNIECMSLMGQKEMHPIFILTWRDLKIDLERRKENTCKALLQIMIIYYLISTVYYLHVSYWNMCTASPFSYYVDKWLFSGRAGEECNWGLKKKAKQIQPNNCSFGVMGGTLSSWSLYMFFYSYRICPKILKKTYFQSWEMSSKLKDPWSAR